MANNCGGVTARYETDRALVRFSGDVDADRIFQLCDEIDFAVDQYFYKHVCIEIDSRGGEAKSLLYFVECLKKWRTKKVRLETKALTNCCSAAAYMLSLGDLGHRSAMTESILLFHNVRISGSSAPMTDENLDSLRWNLSVADAMIITQLLRHLYGSMLPQSTFDTLREIVCCLPDPKRDIDGTVLENALDSRGKRMLHSILACRHEEERLSLRRELNRTLTDQLRKGRRTTGGKHASELPEPIKPTADNRNIRPALEWLYSRFEFYKHEFAKDEYIRPEKAITHKLIDRIGD